MTTAAHIGGGLGLKRAGPQWVGACPFCGYRAGFSVKDGEGGAVLYYCAVGGCTFADIRAALVKRGLLPEPRGEGIHNRKPRAPRIVAPKPSPPVDLNEDESWKNAARIWQGGGPVEGTPVERYLRVARGYRGPLPSPEIMRYVPDLWHKEERTKWPGMVCLVEHTLLGHTGIHRTWLLPDGSGKAPVNPAKKTLAPTKGAAIRLMQPVDGAIAIAEGVESALSFNALYGAPVWSGITAGGIDALILPPEITFVCIASDSDPVGAAHAHSAARRFKAEGRTVRIAMPPPGLDFNDILLAKESK